MMATKNPYQGDDYDFFEAARDESGEIKREAPKADTGNVAKAEPKKETFREAFAAARSAGKDKFTWNGKSYSTEMAKPAAKKSAGNVATSRGATSNMGRVGPTRERAAALPAMPRAPEASTSRGVRAEAPRTAKSEMQRNTASNAAANRERIEAQRKAREERQAKSTESKPMFGRNPKGMTPEELRKSKEVKMAKGGSVSARADGIAKRGKTKCKII
jgi:hypothetical protein